MLFRQRSTSADTPHLGRRLRHDHADLAQAWTHALPDGYAQAPRRGDDLDDARTASAADVQDPRATRLGGAQRTETRVCKVGQGHEVADAGVVGCWPVAIEHVEGRPTAECRLQEQRPEVRLDAAGLVVEAAFMGTGRIEITEAQRADAVGAHEVTDNVFHHQIRAAVGRGGRERYASRSEGAGRTIEGGRGAERDEPLDSGRTHGFHQA